MKSNAIEIYRKISLKYCIFTYSHFMLMKIRRSTFHVISTVARDYGYGTNIMPTTHLRDITDIHTGGQ